MNLRKTAVAIGLSLSLGVSGCSTSPEKQEAVHNKALRNQRTQEFEKITQNFNQKLRGAKEPELRRVLDLVKDGFEYAEPGSWFYSERDEKAKIRLVPYFPEDAELSIKGLEKFSDRGAAVYMDNANTLVVSTEYPLEVQTSNVVHELTHGVQDTQDLHTIDCAVREPEALQAQVIATPYIFGKEVLDVLDRQIEQTEVIDMPGDGNDSIQYGDVSKVEELSDNYSDVEKVRSMFTLIARYYVTNSALRNFYPPEIEDQKFREFAVADYCSNQPA